MPEVKLLPPERGVANNAPFIFTPAAFTAPGLMRNVRHTDRGWEQRPGIERAFPQRGGDGTQPWQGYTVVEQATGITGFEVDVCVPLAGSSFESEDIAGHAWSFEPGLCFVGGYTSPMAAGLYGAFSCGWHPTDPKLCFASIVRDANNNIVTSITLVNSLTGAQLWTAVVDNRDAGQATPRPAGQRAILANSVEVGATYTAVTAAEYVYIFKTETGAYCKRYNLSGWAFEAQCARFRPDGRLVVAFTGTGTVGTLHNQPALVWTALGSLFFRSGVMLYDVTGVDAEPLARRVYGTQLATTDPWFEIGHGYHRFAEWSSRKPRGCIPWGMAVGPDNSVVIGMTNAGWGPDAAHKPDGSTGYNTLYKIDPAGNFAWENATDLILEPYDAAGTTVYNDIPIANPIKPGINAVAIDANGDVFSAGRRTAVALDQGFNVFKNRGADGAPLWKYRASGFVSQNGIGIDPTDGHPIVAMERGASWASSDGIAANLLKLNKFTGNVLDSFDLDQALNSYGLAISNSGRVAYVTDLQP